MAFQWPLLANNNPIGCIFSALFIQYLTYSGTGLGSAFTHKIPVLDRRRHRLFRFVRCVSSE
jgi:ABC-type uncharacterized transport system permease subunit